MRNKNNCKYISWDLKEIINDILHNHNSIDAIYLFGSRAYKTGSKRSDIDILAHSTKPIPIPDLYWIHQKYEAVDLFISEDNTFSLATSIVNGSKLSLREKTNTLPQQLDAVILWDIANGFSTNFSDWVQFSNAEVCFEMTIIPCEPSNDIYETTNNNVQALLSNNIPVYFNGCILNDIANSIIKQLEISLTKPTQFSQKAKNFTWKNFKLCDEYDFQNYIHLVLRSIYPQIQPEPVTIEYDGNKKNADFSINKNSIIIEAKHIKDINTKNTILKTLNGLADFYVQNPNVKIVPFLILYDGHDIVDKYKLESDFSKTYNNIPIFVRFFENEFI